MHGKLKSLSALALTCALSACHPGGAREPLSGKELFASCTSCHGPDGQGNETVASLPSRAQPKTIEADAAAGKASYGTCLACHGPDGKGNEALKAPPIAGQHDWYLVSQLKKFRAGIRGTNPKDVTGAQMRPMSLTLADEQAVKNVVAHIGTLANSK